MTGMMSGMARIRVSTTAEDRFLNRARRLRPGVNDAALLDEALEALIGRHRRQAIDATYAAYAGQPLSAQDAWGNLASLHETAGR